MILNQLMSSSSPGRITNEKWGDISIRDIIALRARNRESLDEEGHVV